MSGPRHVLDATRHLRRWRWAWAWAALTSVALLACGDDDQSGLIQVVDADTSADTQRSPDTVTALDTSGAVDTSPRRFREPCRDNSECEAGWCVPTAEGPACTEGCEEGCPEGWECGLVVNRATDLVAVCLDRAVSLCHPCVEDEDCDRFSVGAGNRCLDYGDRGRFCGLACDFGDAQCPPGYTCAAQDGVPFAEGGQCTPEGGSECGCNALASTLSLATTCAISNALGRCEGARYCGPDGLTACDALTPTEERCNGIDDDCDGQVDEGLSTGAPCEIVNDHGTCPGIGYCVSGAPECIGAPARAETCDGQDQDCDGLTDEGFPDLDGDGAADCVDEDDDGDGTPDDQDCAPKDAAVFRGQTERCGNSIDDDCDGATDEEGAEGCQPYRRDLDEDGFGSKTEPARCLCGPEPATSYTVTDHQDCDDLAPLVYPGAPERCNGVSDDCDEEIDEGVEAPCGGCANLCIVGSGPDTARAFAPTASSAQNVELDGDGALVLSAGQSGGLYRQIFEGWPNSQTHWSVLFVDALTPGDGTTSVTLRCRSAASVAGLGAAAWRAPLGPFPPKNFPAAIDVTGEVIEVEIGLLTTAPGQTPTVTGLSVLAESVP